MEGLKVKYKAGGVERKTGSYGKFRAFSLLLGPVGERKIACVRKIIQKVARRRLCEGLSTFTIKRCSRTKQRQTHDLITNVAHKRSIDGVASVVRDV